MSGVLAPVPREGGWLRVVLATVAFLLLARAPGARAFLPVVDTLTLLFPALAALFVAGWVAGAPGALAFAWVLMAGALLVLPVTSASAGFTSLTQGWGLLVAGAFGLACVASGRGVCLRRALAATGLATIGAVLFAGPAALALPTLGRVFGGEFAARNAATAASFARWLPAVSARFPTAGEWAAARTLALGDVSAAVAAPLAPALLVLESLAACALAWAWYHRLSRTRLGPPLATLRGFTFGHQLVWALVAGGVMLAVPAWRGRGAALFGANIVVLFGALYALRGAAVAAWFVPVRRTAAQIAAAAAALALAPVTFPAALGLGVADSWLDWRGLAHAANPGATPSSTD